MNSKINIYVRRVIHSTAIVDVTRIVSPIEE